MRRALSLLLMFTVLAGHWLSGGLRGVEVTGKDCCSATGRLHVHLGQAAHVHDHAASESTAPRVCDEPDQNDLVVYLPELDALKLSHPVASTLPVKADLSLASLDETVARVPVLVREEFRPPPVCAWDDCPLYLRTLSLRC